MVAARGGLALLHVGGGATEAGAGALARRFTGADLHHGPRLHHPPPGTARPIEHLAGLENVWADFAQHPATADDFAGTSRTWCATSAQGRLLFGSDAPYYDYRRLQAQIEGAVLPERVKDAHRPRQRDAPDPALPAPSGSRTWRPWPEGPAGPVADVDLWRTATRPAGAACSSAPGAERAGPRPARANGTAAERKRAWRARGAAG